MERYFGNADRYEIVSEIGRGGMGQIYSARDRFKDGKKIALKVISDQIRVQNTNLLKNEFLLLSMLSHPNLITVYELDVFQRGGLDLIYYTMEYTDLPNLDQAVAGLGEERKLEIIQIILQALSYVHKRGILHLDLKPKNILVPESNAKDRLKIIDFGLSELKTNIHTLNTSKGSLAFIAPEVFAREKSVDERADLFSLGALILKLYSGNLYRLYKMTDKEINSLLLKYLPDKLSVFVRKLMYIDKNRRFFNANAALDYYVDLMNLKPYRLDKDDYLKVLSRNPRYKLETEIENIIKTIEMAKTPRIHVHGISGAGKSRLINELEVILRTRGYKTVLIGRSHESSFQNFLIRELCLEGVISSDEKSKFDEEISNIIESYVFSKITDIKKTIAYKLADFLEDRLKGSVLLVDNLEKLPKYERDIINIFLSVPDICFAVVITQCLGKNKAEGNFNIEMKNFNFEDTASFVSLCLGLREINPGTLSKIFETTGGNPRKIKEYLFASLNYNVTETPEGLILSMPSNVNISDEDLFPANLFDILVKRMTMQDLIVIYLLNASPKVLNISEIRDILRPLNIDAEIVLGRLKRLDIINSINDNFMTAYHFPDKKIQGLIDKPVLKELKSSLADFISNNNYPYNPYKVLSLFRAIKRPLHGYVEIFKVISRLSLAGDPYNSLEILDFLLFEIGDHEIKEEIIVSFPRLSGTPYYKGPLLFNRDNLLLLKADLLRITGKYSDAIDLFSHMLDDVCNGKMLLHILYTKGTNYLLLGEHLKAYDVFSKLLKIISNKDDFYFFQSLSQMCWIHIQSGELEKSSELLNSFYSVDEELPVTLEMIKAAIFYNLSEHDKAISLLEKICRQNSTLIDKSTLAKIYNNLGILYKMKMDHHKSREYFLMAYSIKKEIGAYESISSTINNLGGLAMAENDNETAYLFYKKALTSSRLLNDTAGIISASINTAFLYNVQGDALQALNMLKRIKPLAESSNNKVLTFFYLQNSFQALLIQNKFDKALDYLDRMNIIANDLKKTNFYLEYKISLLALSLAEMNKDTINPLLRQLSNDKIIRSNPSMYYRYYELLIDWTLIRSVNDQGFAKAAGSMIDRYLDLFFNDGKRSLNERAIRYSLSYLILTNRNIRIYREEEFKQAKEKNYIVYENLELLKALSVLLSCGRVLTSSHNLLFYKRTVSDKKDNNEKIRSALVTILNRLTDYDYLYMNIFPFLIYRTLRILSENDMKSELNLVKKFFFSRTKHRTHAMSNEKQSKYMNNAVVGAIRNC